MYGFTNMRITWMGVIRMTITWMGITCREIACMLITCRLLLLVWGLHARGLHAWVSFGMIKRIHRPYGDYMQEGCMHGYHSG